MTKPRVCEASPIHFVQDVPAALAWYRDILGLGVAFAWPNEEQPAYAGVCCGKSQIHLCGPREWHPPERTYSESYVFVEGVDALAAEIKSRGGTLEQEPTTFPYEMRELTIRDPDGNRITFGASTAAKEAE